MFSGSVKVASNDSISGCQQYIFLKDAGVSISLICLLKPNGALAWVHSVSQDLLSIYHVLGATHVVSHSREPQSLEICSVKGIKISEGHYSMLSTAVLSFWVE